MLNCANCNHEILKDKVGFGHWNRFYQEGGYVSRRCKCGCERPERRKEE
jgi:hypothetical protein